MRKGLKKSAAFLLAVCMIFSLFAGVPMSVKANDEALFVTDCIGGGKFVGEVTYSQYITADLTGARLAFKFAENETAEGAFVKAEKISIAKDDKPADGIASVEECKENSDFCDFTFKEVGDYVVTYDEAGTNNTITIHVDYPVLGFYKENKKTAENFIQDFSFESGKDNTIYVIPNLLEGMTGIEYTINVDDVDSSLVTLDSKASGEKPKCTTGAAVVIKNGATGDFGITATGKVTGEKSGSCEGYLSCHEKMTGLIGTAQTRPPYDEEEGWQIEDSAEFGKEQRGTLGDHLQLALRYVDPTDSSKVTPVTCEDITIYKDGQPVEASEVIVEPFDGNEEFCYFTFNGVGNYVVTYSEQKINNTITIHVDYPVLGFYKTNEKSPKNYIGDLVFESRNESTVYIIPSLALDMKEISYQVQVDDGDAAFVKVGDNNVADGETTYTTEEPVKVTITNKATGNFGIKLSGKAGDWKPENYLMCRESGIVFAWPAWSNVGDDGNPNWQPNYRQIPDEFCKYASVKSDLLLYFGILNTDGSVKAITNANDINTDGNVEVKPYTAGIPGFYEITFTKLGDHTFTAEGTSCIINRYESITPPGGGTTTGGGTTSGGSTSDSNTTTETKPDGSTVETTTETKSDGTKVETITETKTDGTKVETSTETKTDGSKVETSTETKTDGSKTENIVETAADGSVKTTETVTKADGSATKTEKESETNTKGKEVAVTTTTKTDTTGAVTSVTEKSVIEKSSATTSTTVTVKKDGEGTITSASANVAKTVNSGNKATVSAAIVSQIIEAAGTESVSVTMTVKDSEGKTKYKVKVEAENLQAGEELFIYKLNTKTGEYTMVNAKTYEVNESGNVSVSMTKKATYELVTAEDAAQIDKQIKSTIKPKKSSADVKPGKSTDFALSSKANEDNIKSITYTTSKKSVATVSKDGKITAKGKGTVTVKAKVTLKNGTTKTIKMTIKVK
ncbi:MAG: Ig-like domain-containing protein [Lachnospiraceae bacterium]|nr:Ig-like domain-containing protein [Lachnospiraceae bacterium]MDY5520807.1 Ig-like domain-containing protein [Agathobacter sp.]